MKIFQNNYILILTALVAMSAGLWLAKNEQASKNFVQPPKIQGAILQTAKRINPFNLVDHSGKAYSEKNLTNSWNLIFVGYTHCPDICPTTLSLMSNITYEMRQQDLQPPNIVFLSIDPERDTPEVMKRYVEYFNQDFTGLTGSLAEIEKFSKNINAVFKKSPSLNGEINDKEYLMDHSSALLLINPNGNLQSIITAPHTLGNVIDSFLKSQAYYDSSNE